ncbi:hypothetical protein GCM10022237_34320 [Nocardioides ginsengisoli]|uniref:TetR family transcriptional regulator n=1 Tax=Nocardioides ginsengisoli TaxID=363868 RepID=A0ABW3VYH6_9ACTN
MNAPREDWQRQAAAGLAHLSVELMPAMELLYLDGLAAHLLGPEAPAPPYTIEQGTTIASLLLRAVNDAPAVGPDLAPDDDPRAADPGRRAVVGGAHRLAQRGGLGAHRLVARLLPAAVGELESHQDAPEAQVRSLYYYGLMAIASGPENQASAETSASVLATFHAWEARLGNGFIPPWRVPAGSGP